MFAENSFFRLILYAGVAVLILVSLASLSMHYIADDSYITFRYVDRFLDGKGLTWNDGEWVEGYSNPLWAWILIFAGTLGASVPAASQMLGLGFSIVTILAVFLVDWPLKKDESAHDFALAKLLGALTLSFSGIFTVWSVGGLEQPLLAALVAWLFVSVVPILDWIESNKTSTSLNHISRVRIFLSASILAMLVTVRPDGLLYTGILVVTLLWFGRCSKVARILSFQISLLPLITWAGLLLFRIIYYGDYVPNTARVKMAFSFYHIFHYGTRYLLRGYGLLFPLFLVIPLLIYLSANLKVYRARVFFLCAVVFSWSFYLLLIGGDVDPPSRHFVPIVVIVAFQLSALAALSAQQAAHLFSSRNVPLFSIFFGFYILINFIDAEVREARAPYNHFGKSNELSLKYSELLKTAFSELDPLIAVDAAGIGPYITGFRAIDMLGLNDRTIALERPASFGTGWIAHELSNPAYVLGRKPDIIVHNGGGEGCEWKPCTNVIRDLLNQPKFHKEYVRARLVQPSNLQLDGHFWIRHDGKAGIKNYGDEIQIPAIMLNFDGALISFLDPSRQIVTTVTQEAPIKVNAIPLTEGSWRVSLEPQTAPFTIIKSSCVPLGQTQVIDCGNLEGGVEHFIEIVPSELKSELLVRTLHFSRIVDNSRKISER